MNFLLLIKKMAKKIKNLKLKEEHYNKKKIGYRRIKKKLNNIKGIKEYKSSLQKKNNISKCKILQKEDTKENNELKIELYPKNKVIDNLEEELVKDLIDEDIIAHSLNINQKLSYFYSKVPVLEGFYTAHTNHYPIRIKPDDIWLLIVQAFSYHVNSNFDKLRKYFINFKGKKDLVVIYENIANIKQINKKIVEDFSEQINKQLEQYLSKELLDVLTPNFTTTTYDSLIIFKISIMGVFEKYFNYKMKTAICGIPYIILEGNAEDYKKIKSKAEKLSKYEFDWYINPIIPHINKMIEAKEGKIDNNYFKNIVQKKEDSDIERRGCFFKRIKTESIYGWIINFFGDFESIRVSRFDKLDSQMLSVPIKLNNNIDLEYKVGFIGCGKNERNEIFPVQGWILSES